MDWIRFKIGGLIIATAALASLVAPPWFVIVVVGSIAFLLVTLCPATSRWQNGEFVATVTWLLGAILAFSNVMVDGLTFMFLLIVGVVISISWTLREVYGESKPSSIIEWATLLFIPTSLLLVVALAVTDLDLRLRLAGSESALRADVRRIALGRKEILTRQERRVGLFWVGDVEESQGSVFWTTGELFMDYHGLVYSPGGMPTHSGYDFRHICGPWWGFEFDF